MVLASADAQTRLVGVMGWPIEHSLSPAMHGAALEMLGLNWRYMAFPVCSTEVKQAVSGLAALGARGFNVTVPHKTAVYSLLADAALGTVDATACALRAVNTVVIDRLPDGEATLRGYNTDVAGFLGALRAAGVEPRGMRAVVVGAGGAARSVVYALLTAGARNVSVLNRTFARAQALLADLAQEIHSPDQACALPLTGESLVETARSADLLVNTTTVGLWPAVEESIWPDSAPVPATLTVNDLVYNPLETRLLRQTHQAGALAVDGLGMLTRQGALALDLWTEQALDVVAVTALMRAVCKRRLEEQQLSG